MRNCVLSCLRGLQWYWAFMNSFDIRAERYEFQHKFFSPWHYYWKLLSVHCDKKLIIILDIWWIAFINLLFFPFFPFFPLFFFLFCMCVHAWHYKVSICSLCFLKRKQNQATLNPWHILLLPLSMKKLEMKGQSFFLIISSI